MPWLCQVMIIATRVCCDRSVVDSPAQARSVFPRTCPPHARALPHRRHGRLQQQQEPRGARGNERREADGRGRRARRGAASAGCGGRVSRSGRAGGGGAAGAGEVLGSEMGGVWGVRSGGAVSNLGGGGLVLPQSSPQSSSPLSRADSPPTALPEAVPAPAPPPPPAPCLFGPGGAFERAAGCAFCDVELKRWAWVDALAAPTRAVGLAGATPEAQMRSSSRARPDQRSAPWSPPPHEPQRRPPLRARRAPPHGAR